MKCAGDISAGTVATERSDQLRTVAEYIEKE
jgi:hypothetical protein